MKLTQMWKTYRRCNPLSNVNEYVFDKLADRYGDEAVARHNRAIRDALRGLEYNYARARRYDRVCMAKLMEGAA